MWKQNSGDWVYDVVYPDVLTNTDGDQRFTIQILPGPNERSQFTNDHVCVMVNPSVNFSSVELGILGGEEASVFLSPCYLLNEDETWKLRESEAQSFSCKVRMVFRPPLSEVNELVIDDALQLKKV